MAFKLKCSLSSFPLFQSSKPSRLDRLYVVIDSEVPRMELRLTLILRCVSQPLFEIHFAGAESREGFEVEAAL
jgi:hypothetical protein